MKMDMKKGHNERKKKKKIIKKKNNNKEFQLWSNYLKVDRMPKKYNKKIKINFFNVDEWQDDII